MAGEERLAWRVIEEVEKAVVGRYPGDGKDNDGGGLFPGYGA